MLDVKFLYELDLNNSMSDIFLHGALSTSLHTNRTTNKTSEGTLLFVV